MSDGSRISDVAGIRNRTGFPGTAYLAVNWRQSALVGVVAWVTTWLAPDKAEAHGEQMLVVWGADALVGLVVATAVAISSESARTRVWLTLVLFGGCAATCMSPLQSVPVAARDVIPAVLASLIPVLPVLGVYGLLRHRRKQPFRE